MRLEVVVRQESWEEHPERHQRGGRLCQEREEEEWEEDEEEEDSFSSEDVVSTTNPLLCPKIGFQPRAVRESGGLEESQGAWGALGFWSRTRGEENQNVT